MDLVDTLKSEGIVLEGHFNLSSGRHSNLYINKDLIYSNKSLFSKVGMDLIELIKENFDDFDIITGPAIAGAILAAPIALVLNKTFVYPEKLYKTRKIDYYGDACTVLDGKYMDFKRGYEKIIEGKKVIIVEDVVTTGASILSTRDVVIKYGGNVLGSVVIWNRTGNDSLFPITMHSLIKEKEETWEADNCPH